MAHDGCREVEWQGVAFPYLLHHPNSYLQKTENYGSAKQQGGHGHSQPQGYGHGHGAPARPRGSDVHAPAGTGTWNGAAPHGARGANQAPAAPAVVNEPRSVRLSDGTRLPMIGLGTFGIKDPAVIKTALEIGYRHLDCAWCYGNEDVVGEGLKDFIAAGRRSELFVVSKVWNTHHRPDDVRKYTEESLAKLGCGYLDLLLVHWPDAFLPGSSLDDAKPDTEAPLLDMWRAMEGLVDSGKVKALGVSNFSLKQVEELQAAARVKPVAQQIELHPLLAQRKLVGVLFRHGVQCVAYCPLGGQSAVVPNDLITNPVVAQVAKEVGKTPGQVLIKWNIQRGVPVIVKSSHTERLKENLEGMYSWKLSNEHKAVLDALDCGKRYITFPWHQWADPEEGGVTKPSIAMKNL